MKVGAQNLNFIKKIAQTKAVVASSVPCNTYTNININLNMLLAKYNVLHSFMGTFLCEDGD